MRRAFRWIMAILIAMGLLSAHWAIAGYGFEASPPQSEPELSDYNL